jgi:hypothetical protein
MKRLNGYTVLMKPPLIANGAEIPRIGGGVEIAKIEQKVQAPRLNINVSVGLSEMKLKWHNNIFRAQRRCG